MFSKCSSKRRTFLLRKLTSASFENQFSGMRNHETTSCSKFKRKKKSHWSFLEIFFVSIHLPTCLRYRLLPTTLTENRLNHLHISYYIINCRLSILECSPCMEFTAIQPLYLMVLSTAQPRSNPGCYILKKPELCVDAIKSKNCQSIKDEYEMKTWRFDRCVSLSV